MDELKTQSAKRKVKTQSLKFLVLSFSFTFFALRFTLPCFAQDKIVAIVNNEIITQRDLDDFINFMYVQLQFQYKGKDLDTQIQSMKQDLLDKLIDDRLILQEAKKDNIKVDKNTVKARLDEVRKHYLSDSEFQSALAQQGLTQADIETRIREQLLMREIIDRKVRNKIVVNPSEVTEFYQKNMEKFKTPEGREIESINVESAQQFNKIFNELKENGDLNSVAKEYSLKVNKITVRRNEELRKDIEEVVFNLKPGEFSRPIKIDNSFYIFKLNNIIMPRQQGILEVQDEIYDLIFNYKMQEGMYKWLDELKKNSYIKIL